MIKSKYFSIAIDGPAGCGKSTIAKLFATRHPEFIYINTGLMFRAIAYYLYINKIDYNDEKNIVNILDNIQLKIDNDSVSLFLNNQWIDISNETRSETISKISSRIAQYQPVRTKLLNLQHEFANNNNVVMDGRDITTIVLPKADIKIYVNCDVNTRAVRRYNQLKQQGFDNIDLDTILIEIQKRDEYDKNRKIAPLVELPEAYKLDTSNKSIEENMQEVEKIYLSVYNIKNN